MHCPLFVGKLDIQPPTADMCLSQATLLEFCAVSITKVKGLILNLVNRLLAEDVTRVVLVNLELTVVDGVRNGVLAALPPRATDLGKGTPLTHADTTPLAASALRRGAQCA